MAINPKLIKKALDVAKKSKQASNAAKNISNATSKADVTKQIISSTKKNVPAPTTNMSPGSLSAGRQKVNDVRKSLDNAKQSEQSQARNASQTASNYSSKKQETTAPTTNNVDAEPVATQPKLNGRGFLGASANPMKNFGAAKATPAAGNFASSALKNWLLITLMNPLNWGFIIISFVLLVILGVALGNSISSDITIQKIKYEVPKVEVANNDPCVDKVKKCGGFNYKRVFFIGDSRTCYMHMHLTGSNMYPATGTAIDDSGTELYHGLGGKGYKEFMQEQAPWIDQRVSSGDAIFIWMGTNDIVGDLDTVIGEYAPFLNKKAAEWTAKGARVFYGEITAENPDYPHGNNEKYQAYSAKLKSKISADITWIGGLYDLSLSMGGAGFSPNDWIHQGKEMSQKMHDKIIEGIKGGNGTECVEGESGTDSVIGSDKVYFNEAGVDRDVMNRVSVGIEICHLEGDGEYPESQLKSVDNLIAYIREQTSSKGGSSAKITFHKEWTPDNKSDPTDMSSDMIEKYRTTDSHDGKRNGSASAAKSSIQSGYIDNNGFAQGGLSTVKYIMLHSTESGYGGAGQEDAEAKSVLSYWQPGHERSNDGNNRIGVAAHFVVARNGNIYQLIDLDYYAWHAGAPNSKSHVESFGLDPTGGGANSSNTSGTLTTGSDLSSGGAVNNVSMDTLPVKNQKPLDNGCEITSLAMVLDWYGYSVSHTDLVKYLETGGMDACDPEEMFVGDPAKNNEGRGCFAKPLIAAGQKYLSENGGSLSFVDKTGSDIEDLFGYIDKKIPVIIWGTLDNQETRGQQSWTVGGRTITWTLGEHCMVMVNYSDDKITVADPYQGKMMEYDRSSFTSHYNAMGKRAIAVGDGISNLKADNNKKPGYCEEEKEKTKSGGFDGEWVLYNQGDGSQWGGASLGTGCGCVCLSMIFTSYTKDKKFTPAYLIEKGLCNSQGWLMFADTSGIDGFCQSNNIPLTAVHGTSTDKGWKDNWNLVQETCSKGGCVMIGQNALGATGGSHYVVITKIENGNCFVANPAGGTMTEISETEFRNLGYSGNTTQCVYFTPK